MSLISLRKPILANGLLFIRTASWVYPFIGLGLIFPQLRSFSCLLYFWLGGLAATFLGLLFGLRAWPLRRIATAAVDRRWIRRRISGSGLIYASDLGLVGAAFLDRFIVNHDLGLEQTGIYTFYWSLANAVQVLVNTGIIQLGLPRLVDAVRAADPTAFRRVLLGETAKSLGFGIPMAIGLYGAVELLLPYLHRPPLQHHVWLFPSLLLGTTLRYLSDVVSYGLYARGQDRAWSLANLLSVPVGAMLTVLGLTLLGLEGAGFALCVCAALMLMLRVLYLRQGGWAIGTAMPALCRE